MTLDILTFDELAKRYCSKQQCTVEWLMYKLRIVRQDFDPTGFMLLECKDLSSSHFGSYTILPYGGKSTYKEIPQGPISPRGLASDMSIPVAIMNANEVPLIVKVTQQAV